MEYPQIHHPIAHLQNYMCSIIYRHLIFYQRMLTEEDKDLDILFNGPAGDSDANGDDEDEDEDEDEDDEDDKNTE